MLQSPHRSVAARSRQEEYMEPLAYMAFLISLTRTGIMSGEFAFVVNLSSRQLVDAYRRVNGVPIYAGSNHRAFNDSRARGDLLVELPLHFEGNLSDVPLISVVPPVGASREDWRTAEEIVLRWLRGWGEWSNTQLERLASTAAPGQHD